MIVLFSDERATSAPLSPGSHLSRENLFNFVYSESRPPMTDRPWIFCNMIASADGGAVLEGKAAPLGGPADQSMLGALRHSADAVLAGAETAAIEGYGRPRSGAPLVLLTRSGSLNPAPPAMHDPEAHVIIVTTSHGAAALDVDLSQNNELMVTDGADGGIDLPTMARQLADRGFRRVVCEGGPRLNGAMATAGLIDEWNLTISPMLIGGTGLRPLVSGETVQLDRYRLTRVLLAEDMVMNRYVRADHPALT